jgi:hypothetical protein
LLTLGTTLITSDLINSVRDGISTQQRLIRPESSSDSD